jgi:glycosyltransferase involved in cell wall biosynthesis
MATICLVMIVKNEEELIVRSLTSALPFVDTFCIVDTGSSDSTILKIQETAQSLGVKGEIHERPWVNFGHNRSEVLKLAHDMNPRPTWCLTLDADDILHMPPREELSILQSTFAQGLYMNIVRGSLSFKRVTLFNTMNNWYYVGAVHEYPKCPGYDESKLFSLPDSAWLDARCEGARSKDPLKYQKDGELLEAECEKDPYNTRAIFYAAQSYRDARLYEKSRAFYQKCTESMGWIQERYIAYLNLIRLTESIDEKYCLAWKAADLCPSRVEATHEVLKATREKSLWSLQAYALGVIANTNIGKNDKKDMLFVEKDVYTYKFYDEFSIHCYYLGYDEESSDAASKALEQAPPAEEVRIRVNYEFALKRIN